jgi:hypothetical protein
MNVSRRQFVKSAGAATALGANAVAATRGVSIISTADQSAPVQWALAELARSITAHGATVFRCGSVSQAKPDDLCLVVSAGTGTAESFELSPTVIDKRRVLQVRGGDVRGLVYALLELSDRVKYSPDPFAVHVVETPSNAVRGINRLFTSDVEDKPWFNDREMWPQYLTMLAGHRFNRFSLALGIGYDFIRQVTDAYFLFPYPFFLQVPGYAVRASLCPTPSATAIWPCCNSLANRPSLAVWNFSLACGCMVMNGLIARTRVTRLKVSPNRTTLPIAAMHSGCCFKSAPRLAV